MKNSSGYIALMSSVVIAIVLMAITLSLNLSSFLGRTNILESTYKEMSSDLADACGDIAILRLAENSSYAPPVGGETVTVGSSTCKIVTVQASSSQKVITTQAIVQKSYTNLQITVTPSSTNIAIDEWKETPSL